MGRKFVHHDSRCTDQTAQRSFGNFFVVGNGKRRDLALFNHDNVTAALAGDLPTEPFKSANDLASAYS
jgi:hypothetical protein